MNRKNQKKGMQKWMRFCGGMAVVLAAFLLTASGVPQQAKAATYVPVSIDQDNFPDPAFREYVKKKYDGGDNSLDATEMATIKLEKEIDVHTYVNTSPNPLKVKNLQKGLEYFTALETLLCDDIGLESLNISKNTNLKVLTCANNNLTTLNVSKNPELTKLNCSNNQLESLDIRENTKLQELDCSNNNLKESLYCYSSNLTKLYANNNPNLKTLYCSYSKLTELDVRGDTNLTSLSCYSNKLTMLDVSSNTNLTELYCSNNKLTMLDVSSNPKLTDLNCSYNQLTMLDVSKNPKLTDLNCSVNSLTGKLDVSDSTKLLTLNCSENQLAELDVSMHRLLRDLYCSNNQLIGLDISKNTALEKLYCKNDAYGKKKLTVLNIGYNHALNTLDCSFNDLTMLNLSVNIGLADLNCSNNQLTNLDVEKHTSLEYLTCSNNKLAVLDISKNTALRNLYCSNNKLTELDVSRKPALTELDCSNNRLTKLDVGASPALTELKSSDNSQLAEFKFHRRTQTLGQLKLTVKDLHGDNYETSVPSNCSIDYSVDSRGLLEVKDPSKIATYKVVYKAPVIVAADVPADVAADGMLVTIIYAGSVYGPEDPDRLVPSGKYLYYDFNYTEKVTEGVFIYGNGISKKIDGVTEDSRVFTAYTDIKASYTFKQGKSRVQSSTGRVIAMVSKSSERPEIIDGRVSPDKSAAAIAKATVKSGIVKVTAVGKEGGRVYLWVLDTGAERAWTCCPVFVKLLPKKLEVRDTSGTKLSGTRLGVGSKMEVQAVGLVGTLETEYAVYEVEVDSKYEGYIKVEPVTGSWDSFIITAKGLKNYKDTKVSITFRCSQNKKYVRVPLTITPAGA